MTNPLPRTVPVDRRTVLRAAGLSTGAALVAGATLAGAAPAGAASDAFRHGIASGDPLPDGILLWTRVTPTADAVPGSGAGPDVEVAWQVAADPDFSSVVRAGTLVTGANWEGGYFAAYRHLAARGDLNLVLHLGDYIYEYGTGQFAAAGRVVRPARPANEILTLADYRIRHALYKTDPDLQALHAAVPWVITWDDHEVANDEWSDGAENHNPATEGDFGARKAAAHRAYWEWMPVRMSDENTIYRRIRLGRLAELSMLDLRSYRSKQVSGPAVDDPARSITGDTQMAWLTSGLATSTARWKLVGNPVMISRLDVATLPAWLLGPLGKLLGIPSNGFAVTPTSGTATTPTG